MKMFTRVLVSLAAFGLALSSSYAADASAAAKKKVLFFTKSSGYEHDAIKLQMRDGKPGYAFAVLKSLGEKNNFDVVFSKDGSLFTPAYLAQFDAFVFYTTGDLTLAKNNEALGDGNPPMTAEGKAAFFKAIEGGKGFVGVHSAADTFHSPGNKNDNTPERHVTDGAKADPYIRLLGGEFIKHDAQQPAHQLVVDAKFPGLSAVPADFGPQEEWYSLKNFPADLHVLLVQETKDMKGPSYEREPYPSTWARMQGKGRVFYTSMGHREDVWNNPAFQAVLAGGIDWALGRVKADVKPNLAKVAPQANTLPKFPVPQPKAAPAPQAGGTKTP
jgi:uncharacterized protein